MTFADRAVRGIAIVWLTCLVGCAHRGPVERLVDGRVVRGPAISETAYAAYLEGSIALEEGRREESQQAFALAESEDVQLREWDQTEQVNVATRRTPSLAGPPGSAIALALANPTVPRGWLQVLRNGRAQERAWAGCELVLRWPRFAPTLEPVALELAETKALNEARLLASCVATRASHPGVKALALDDSLYVAADERVFDVASRLRLDIADVLVRAYAVLGPNRSAVLFARAATFAPAAVEQAEARLTPRGA
jgi:uncharacterized protein YkwD